jgi:toxin ParE1/3/4
VIRLWFTSRAERDLVDIYDYIAEENPQAAIRVLNQIEKRCQSLCAHPKIGQQCDEISPGLRSVAEGRYLIFYRLAPGEIQVIRILHRARDVTELLK